MVRFLVHGDVNQSPRPETKRSNRQDLKKQVLVWWFRDQDLKLDNHRQDQVCF
ncbi:hypothetical protein Hanom_Chr07g00593921 [Helianthus anomalus]